MILTTLAFDRASVRRFDEDGRLHVATSNLSKSVINPYWGREIPNFEKLGLDPDKKYLLLRHPDELAKAARTFNNLPILAEHIPITAAKHPAHLVVGSTGTDAKYVHPYLKNSLVFWTKPAIDAIEGDEQKELSCAYHYDPDMTPGVYEGQRYDGVMRNIRGNHVAQVKDGRAGSDVVVQDAAFKEAHDSAPGGNQGGTTMSKTKLTPAGLVARSALFTYITPQLAMDAAGKRPQIDYNAILAGVTSKNFDEKKKGIFNSVKMATKGKLAQDADLGDLAQLLDAFSPEAEQADAMMTEPNSATPPMRREGEDDTDPTDMVSKIKAYLEEQGVAPEILANLDAFLAEPANPDPDTPTPGEDGDMPRSGMDEDEDDDERKRTAEDDIVPNEQKESVTKTAMDAAIKTAVANTTKQILATQRNIRIAEREVQPWVGQLAFDSANGPSDVYRTTLKALGMDAKEVDALHADALKPILKVQPKPSRDDLRRPGAKKLAQDASDKKTPSLGEMFPGAANITVQ
jgi:hypothetical protein